jgi:hypothetical protein
MKLNNFILLTLLLSSCTANEVKVTPAALNGKWAFTKALRAGKETKTLHSAYLEFMDSIHVNSNIFQSEEPHTYIIDDKTIVINSIDSLSLEVTRLEKDTMVMEGVVNKYPMEFYLVKE